MRELFDRHILQIESEMPWAERLDAPRRAESLHGLCTGSRPLSRASRITLPRCRHQLSVPGTTTCFISLACIKYQVIKQVPKAAMLNILPRRSAIAGLAASRMMHTLPHWSTLDMGIRDLPASIGIVWIISAMAWLA